MSERVLVTGSGGQLGVELCREFERRGWHVEGLDRKTLDVTNRDLVLEAVSTRKPALVINAAAYNQVDQAESQPETAYAANALAVCHLAIACRENGAKLVHFSTDYVFDGTKGSPYVEADAPHPIGAYAVSKYAGELYARAYLDDALVLRVSGVFGTGGMFTPRGNFIELMLRLARNGSPIRVVSDFVASPTYALPLASRTADMVDERMSGVFHIGGGEAISWYDYTRLIFEVAGLEPDLKATTEQEYKTPAKRPKFSALSNEQIEKAGIAPMPTLRDAVADYMKRRGQAKPHRSE